MIYVTVPPAALCRAAGFDPRAPYHSYLRFRVARENLALIVRQAWVTHESSGHAALLRTFRAVLRALTRTSRAIA
jgi:hypothetical protein